MSKTACKFWDLGCLSRKSSTLKTWITLARRRMWVSFRRWVDQEATTVRSPFVSAFVRFTESTRRSSCHLTAPVLYFVREVACSCPGTRHSGLDTQLRGDATATTRARTDFRTTPGVAADAAPKHSLPSRPWSRRSREPRARCKTSQPQRHLWIREPPGTRPPALAALLSLSRRSR